MCRQCLNPVPKGLRTFCGNACVHEWRLRTDPGYLRAMVYKRDKGVCAVCGRDTEKLKRELNALRSGSWIEWQARKRELGIPSHRQTLWDADHIVPVIEGGGECDLSNMRTLCLWCHKDATAQLAKRRSKAGGGTA